METMTALPNLEGRKFGALSLGYDRIETIRMEFGALASLAALVIGVPVEELTVRGVGNFVADVQGRMASFDGDREALVAALADLDAAVGDGGTELGRPQVLAWALAYLRASMPTST